MPEMSPETLFRFLVVSEVVARITHGERQVDVVADVANHPHHSIVDGTMRTVSLRSVYRWMKRQER